MSTIICERSEELLKVLENTPKTRDAGGEICRAVGRFYNAFNVIKETSELYDALSPKAKKTFMAAWALAGLSLAYDRKRFGKQTWDDRKKAAEDYSMRHLPEIEKIFEKNTGISLKVSLEETSLINGISFSTWIFLQLGRDALSGKEWILGFADRFCSEHSTLKQSFFRGMVCGVLIPNHLISDYGDSHFPFI